MAGNAPVKYTGIVSFFRIYHQYTIWLG
jgi:hypothetical protein